MIKNTPKHYQRPPYYPISEGELRQTLDMEHIPHNATLKQIGEANTEILATILNRDPCRTKDQLVIPVNHQRISEDYKTRIISERMFRTVANVLASEGFKDLAAEMIEDSVKYETFSIQQAVDMVMDDMRPSVDYLKKHIDEENTKIRLANEVKNAEASNRAGDLWAAYYGTLQQIPKYIRGETDDTV